MSECITMLKGFVVVVVVVIVLFGGLFCFFF